MTVREELDELKFQLKIKTDSALAEYLGVSPSALTKWLSRDDLPYKWQIKIQTIKNNKNENGILVVKNNGKISINTSTFNHSGQIQEIIQLLQYSPPAYLDVIKKKLEKYKEMMNE